MCLGSGSGKNLFRIPDPGPGVKKAPDPGSRIRIRNTASHIWKSLALWKCPRLLTSGWHQGATLRGERGPMGPRVGQPRRKIRLIDVNAKCRHLKNLTCKGTSGGRCVSELIDWLEIANFLRCSVLLVFSTQRCDLYSPLLPLSPSLW